MNGPYGPSETADAYVEAARVAEISSHGATDTSKRLPPSVVNSGVAFQILKDNPHLAANVTRVRADGQTTTHGVTLHVTGDQDTVAAWVEFLGPAARVHPRVPYGDHAWEQAVTTIDTAVIIRHHEVNR